MANKEKRTRLFVIVDPTSTTQVALVKALLIARLADCHIHAFLCVHKDIEKDGDGSTSRRDFKHDQLREAETWLEEQLAACRASEVPYTTEIVWNSRWVESVTRSVAKADCDLMIKSSFQHSKTRRVFSKTSDYTLMRYCACPILFTHQEQAWKSDRILACLDLESGDPQHDRLNGKILRDARAFADIVGMDLHVASAYHERLDAARLPGGKPGQDVSAEFLGELYNLKPERVLLRKGETIETLRAICAEVDPSILMIGSIARTGIRGKLIGNTAEKLLDLVDADILTVN